MVKWSRKKIKEIQAVKIVNQGTLPIQFGAISTHIPTLIFKAVQKGCKDENAAINVEQNSHHVHLKTKG